MQTELQRLCAENAAAWAANPDLMAIAAALTDGPEASPADYLPAPDGDPDDR